MSDFMTPPKHVHFRAKKLFGEMGRIVDGSIAYIDYETVGANGSMLMVATSGTAVVIWPPNSPQRIPGKHLFAHWG